VVKTGEVTAVRIEVCVFTVMSAMVTKIVAPVLPSTKRRRAATTLREHWEVARPRVEATACVYTGRLAWISAADLSVSIAKRTSSKLVASSVAGSVVSSKVMSVMKRAPAVLSGL